MYSTVQKLFFFGCFWKMFFCSYVLHGCICLIKITVKQYYCELLLKFILELLLELISFVF